MITLKDIKVDFNDWSDWKSSIALNASNLDFRHQGTRIKE